MKYERQIKQELAREYQIISYIIKIDRKKDKNDDEGLWREGYSSREEKYAKRMIRMILVDGYSKLLLNDKNYCEKDKKDCRVDGILESGRKMCKKQNYKNDCHQPMRIIINA